MNRHALSAFLVLALVFILSSITASAQQPRTVPDNDHFVNAKTIKIGKSYKVPDIAAATNEGGEPGALCKYASGPIAHSVWFTFTLPEQSFIFLSTFGTLLFEPDLQSMDTVLAVYELTGVGVFTERACSDSGNGTTAAQLMFSAEAGITYYIAAGTYETTAYLPESTLKLSTRMLTTPIFAPNYGFETPISSANWKLKNGSDDEIVCSDAAYPALHGDCTFRFTGTPGVRTTLMQTVAFPASFAPRKSAILSTAFYFLVADSATIGTTKVKVVVNYSDGTPPSIQTVNLTGATAKGYYELRQVAQPLKSSKVASIKFMVRFASPTGVLLIDYVRHSYSADPATRGAGLLPVPPSPSAG
jgi:hypothetical protein